MSKIALVAAKGLGDGLLAQILAHNLTLSGNQVTTFNTPLTQLRGWFPLADIQPFQEVFHAFDEVWAMDHSPVKECHKVFKQNRMDKQKTFTENLALICKHELKLPFHGIENGIHVPQHLEFRKNPQRVVLHAMSSEEHKNWPKSKFIQLALLLHSRGFFPSIVVSPDERKGWREIEQHPNIALPHFATLSDTASYIYESGFLIGNDSGLGHLASNLGIETLSLFARESYSRLWRPGWGGNSVVTPLPVLFGAPLKQRYWKQFLPVKRVLRRFMKNPSVRTTLGL